MNDSFGVGVRAKTMPLSLKFTSQIGEVVDFAVVGDPHRPIFVAHRHVAIGREVEDRKTPAPQSDIPPFGETRPQSPEASGPPCIWTFGIPAGVFPSPPFI